jgi:hypothetical protein
MYLIPQPRTGIQQKSVDSKHVLKVYFKPRIFTTSNFACLCEKCPLKTQSGCYSTFIYMVKMESISGSEITIFGQKMIVKSGLEIP